MKKNLMQNKILCLFVCLLLSLYPCKDICLLVHQARKVFNTHGNKIIHHYLCCCHPPNADYPWRMEKRYKKDTVMCRYKSAHWINALPPRLRNTRGAKNRSDWMLLSGVTPRCVRRGTGHYLGPRRPGKMETIPTIQLCCQVSMHPLLHLQTHRRMQTHARAQPH